MKNNISLTTYVHQYHRLLEVPQPISYVMQQIFILPVLILNFTVIPSYALFSETETNYQTMCVTYLAKWHWNVI